MALNQTAVEKSQSTETPLDYTKVVQSPAFQQLLMEKRKFILPLSLFFLAFYFTLPILTAYTSFLNKPAAGSITWAWVFAAAQFVMTWTLCILYTKRAARFDEMVDEIKREHGREESS
ncbi:DUF485 domain-containing protein [Mesobacillus zeae]|uniref:DUF485 domain-containing protein n=1 Tax=Mesobacillus zeae TaxID=1917180 RepID=A0A398B9Z2_9BACI|nr:DUF485 domain-containing protein [Mesobacillus zeae]RID86805.1 DUF485 domain-containing protein [Mesobacillus zeae]